MGTNDRNGGGKLHPKVSIQLISPASGDGVNLTDWVHLLNIVSIQLISPASGDVAPLFPDNWLLSFHSINIPSEWGLDVQETTSKEESFPFN